MEHGSLPLFDWQDTRGRRLRLNSFALDVIVHGDYEKALFESGLPDDVGWSHLNDIAMILQKISKAVHEMSNLTDQIKAEADARKQAEDAWMEGYTLQQRHRYAVRGTGKVVRQKATGKLMSWDKVKKQQKKSKVMTEKIVDPIVQAFEYLSKHFSVMFYQAVGEYYAKRE